VALHHLRLYLRPATSTSCRPFQGEGFSRSVLKPDSELTPSICRTPPGQ